jgi:hypothetical protein
MDGRAVSSDEAELVRRNCNLGAPFMIAVTGAQPQTFVPEPKRDEVKRAA